MTRKNNRPNYTPRPLPHPRQAKRRFETERQAHAAAEHQMLLNQELDLTVYKDIDGGWYLTRRKTPLEEWPR